MKVSVVAIADAIAGLRMPFHSLVSFSHLYNSMGILPSLLSNGYQGLFPWR